MGKKLIHFLLDFVLEPELPEFEIKDETQPKRNSSFWKFAQPASCYKFRHKSESTCPDFTECIENTIPGLRVGAKKSKNGKYSGPNERKTIYEVGCTDGHVPGTRCEFSFCSSWLVFLETQMMFLSSANATTKVAASGNPLSSTSSVFPTAR